MSQFQFSADDLLRFIEGHLEGVALDYKKESYHIAVPKDMRDREDIKKKAEKKKKDLIVDLAAMANTNGAGLAVIVTGVQEKEGKGFEKIGIQAGLYSDHIYQELLQTAINPPLQFTYCEATSPYEKIFGFFIIYNNNNRPYILAKSLYGAFQEGTIPYRQGSTNQIVKDFRVIEQWKKEDSLIESTNSKSSPILILESLPFNIDQLFKRFQNAYERRDIDGISDIISENFVGDHRYGKTKRDFISLMRNTLKSFNYGITPKLHIDIHNTTLNTDEIFSAVISMNAKLRWLSFPTPLKYDSARLLCEARPEGDAKYWRITKIIVFKP